MTNERIEQKTRGAGAQLPGAVPVERSGVGPGLLALLGVTAPSEPREPAPALNHCDQGLDALPVLPRLAPSDCRGNAAPCEPSRLRVPHPSAFLAAAPDSLVGALCALDPSNPDHWTADGSPRLDAVFAVYGAEVTRRDIADAFPGFNRDRARQGIVDAPPRAPEPAHQDAGHAHQVAQRAFRRRLRAARLALAEHAQLERALGRRLPRPDFRCALQRRIAAENRLTRYRADRR